MVTLAEESVAIARNQIVDAVAEGPRDKAKNADKRKSFKIRKYSYRRVAALIPLVAPHARALIDDFYAEIQRHPEAARVIPGGAEQIKRLKVTLREWLAQLLGGQYDAAYMSRRWKVGYRHVEIGLAQR